MPKQPLQVSIEKHPTENKGRLIVTAAPGQEADLDLLYQAILTTKRKEGHYPPHMKNSFAVIFETSAEWRDAQ
jgi:hypothetical protein